jgi:hypothetical protein
VAREVTTTTMRQSTPPLARIRCGNAEPIVRAPVIVPRAKPRSARYQVAIAFIAGG